MPSTVAPGRPGASHEGVVPGWNSRVPKAMPDGRRATAGPLADWVRPWTTGTSRVHDGDAWPRFVGGVAQTGSGICAVGRTQVFETTRPDGSAGHDGPTRRRHGAPRPPGHEVPRPSRRRRASSSPAQQPCQGDRSWAHRGMHPSRVRQVDCSGTSLASHAPPQHGCHWIPARTTFAVLALRCRGARRRSAGGRPTGGTPPARSADPTAG